MTSQQLRGDHDREIVLAEIPKIAQEIAGLWGSPDFLRPAAPEMLSDTVRLAGEFAREPFQHEDGVRSGVPPWILNASEVAVRELLRDILRILMREDRTGDLEALCANLIDLEKSAAEETFRLATGLANEEDEELGVWANIIQLLAQRQLVMRSRLATAALQRDIEGIREVAAEVAQVAAESRDNAGMVGELELATYFDQLAKDERSTANKFRYAAIGILVLSAGLVYGVSFEKAISTGEIIRHVAFVLPALGLSTYLGAEAAKHRRSAQWAEAVKVQLRTVGLFCASMDRESATSIRKHLANRVFGALPGEGSEPPTDVALSPAVLEQLAVLVRTSKG